LLAEPSKVTSAQIAFPSREHAIAHLFSHSPEVLALVDDFGICIDRLAAAEDAVRNVEGEQGADHPAASLAHLYHRASALASCRSQA
jgi:hypothetical protein